MTKLTPEIPSIDLNNYIVDPEIVNSIPERLARKHRMIPLFRIKDSLTIAVASSENFMAIDEARAVSGYNNIQLVKAEAGQILAAIEQYYTVSNSIEDIVNDLEKMDLDFVPQEKLDLVRLQRITEEPPIIKLVNLILAQALKDNASDIHIEPEEEKVRVRLRIDGVLHTLIELTRRMELPIVPRIKVISGLDIMERRKPQDGRFRVRVEDREVDLRISTFPVAFGEKVVMRILDRSTAFLGLEKLGFSPGSCAEFESWIKKPYGIILVTGPTGSGKTSTLYAALSKLNSAEKNIVTLENPREYLLAGINQSEVNPEIGFGFAEGLRSILRQDPDIIMVGEIRDLETAEISIRAALTGHLVFSTLHTNDAPGAITRLIDMGIEPFLLSSSIIGVLAQRLVRVICPSCKEQYEPGNEVYEKMGLEKSKKITFYRGRGCLSCRQTGYKGRLGILELMKIDGPLRELMSKTRATAEIRKAAIKAGMKTLLEDGYDKVIQGITTLEEVLRVTYSEE